MIRARINWSGPASGFSIMHFDGDLSTAGLAQSTADAVTTFIQGFDQTMSTQMTAEVDNEILEIDVGTGQTTGVETVTTAPITGGTADGMLPQATQALVRWRTGFFSGGREIRGRTFIPGFTEASGTTNGEMDGTLSALIQTAGDTLMGSTEFGVWSPTKSLFATATSCSVWNEWAVQRGRRQ